MALTTSNPSGDRKAIAVCHCHDLGRLAASSLSNARSPFLAPAWVPSMYASVRSSFPRVRRSSARALSTLWSTPVWDQAWKRRWQVWYGGYRGGRSAHGAPVLSTHMTALRTSRTGRNGRPPFGVVRLSSSAGKKCAIAAHCSSVRSTVRVDQKSRRLSIPTGFPIEFHALTRARL